MFGFFKRRRRDRLRAVPMPAAWVEIIDKNVPLCKRLSEADQRELHGHVQVFLAEKYFEGCGGLELSDEIKVTIAAQACLLLLRRDADYYPRLITILVYPAAYLASSVEHLGAGATLEGEEVRLGEAWKTGVVVLSWDDVRDGSLDLRDGRNLVLHEFAHQLDMEDGAADGTPLLDRRQRRAWAEILGDEYDRLRRDCVLGRSTVLDKYGATDPAEFFAVATECFFETPERLRRRHPGLYGQLRAFYRRDPASDAR
jgi:Mlc titration factor MtfA (ptsG expression regulator)